ncbi:TRAP transporter substrate-binding protein [Azospirillum sp.]|uniref:TRAP transporter substrate-binding protein n=1 Tax=Azospirillum sp. TaxID=34012 RepID=UPI003D70958B
MKRRSFLTAAGTGLGAAALAAPAMAQGLPEVEWQLASSYPRSLDTVYGAVERIAARVAEVTEGRFRIQPSPPNAVVPALQVLDAVQGGAVPCGQSAAYFYIDKDPTFCFDTGMPFGLNTRQQAAWMTHGGGLELMRDFYRGYNVTMLPAGSTGAQMGGWFRKEIRTVEDLKGIRMRIGGLAGRILATLGVQPVAMGGGDIRAALELGAIDAAEFVGPYDDERLGLHRVAKYYYYPGWWEGAAQIALFVNLDAWAALPRPFQAALEQACAEAQGWMLGKYDALNAAALRRLVAAGAVLKPFPREVMEACYEAAFALYDEIAARNPRFKRVYDAWASFRDEEYLWFRVAESSFDSFVYGAAARRKV